MRSYYILRLSSFKLKLLPRSIIKILAIIISAIAFKCMRSRRIIAISNVQRCYPNLQLWEIEAIAKKSFFYMVLGGLDCIRNSSLSLEKIQKQYQFTARTLDAISDLKNSPAIILSQHFGNWELPITALSLAGLEIHALAARQKNAGANLFINQLRERYNSKVIYKDESFWKLIHAVKSKIVSFLVDQNSFDMSHIKVNFRSVPTSFPRGAYLLYKKSKVPVYVVSCTYTDNDNICLIDLYKLNLEHKIDTETGVVEEQIFSQLVTDELEKIVVNAPEQYFWIHRKWNKNMVGALH